MADRLGTVGVVGSGTMGIGIAQAAAGAGYRVRLHDMKEDVLARAMEGLCGQLERLQAKGKMTAEEAEALLGRIAVTTELEDFADAEIVAEAISEKLGNKNALFHRLEKIVPPSTILASNTSSLPITGIAAKLEHPERVVGLHFFNPVPVMKLVEVVKGLQTEQAAVEQAVAFAESLGKTVVVCGDTPGFVVNRVARGFYGEAMRLVQEGVVVIEQMDHLARSEGNFRMGPFELMDLIGIDVNYEVTRAVYHMNFEEPRYRPNLMQQRMVSAGLLGRKTGKGFYSYE